MPLDTGSLWIGFTLVASAAQTARNAMQRELTGTLGTVGATHVRFLFGFPFALLSLAAITWFGGSALPRPDAAFWPWVLGGATTQILATALLLAAMGTRSFVVAIAYSKTEPLHVAVFGLVFLGDALTPMLALAIGVATAGVMLASWKSPQSTEGGARAAMLGITSGALFGLSAVGYRGAILTLSEVSFVQAATFTLAVALVAQAAALTLYLAVRDRSVLARIFAAWRPSLFAGFMGALASQFWFLAFAVATAASVRTLALIEVLFAQAVAYIVFRQRSGSRELIGISLIIAGVALLLRTQ